MMIRRPLDLYRRAEPSLGLSRLDTHWGPRAHDWQGRAGAMPRNASICRCCYDKSTGRRAGRSLATQHDVSSAWHGVGKSRMLCTSPRRTRAKERIGTRVRVVWSCVTAEAAQIQGQNAGRERVDVSVGSTREDALAMAMLGREQSVVSVCGRRGRRCMRGGRQVAVAGGRGREWVTGDAGAGAGEASEAGAKQQRQCKWQRRERARRVSG